MCGYPKDPSSLARKRVRSLLAVTDNVNGGGVTQVVADGPDGS